MAYIAGLFDGEGSVSITHLTVQKSAFDCHVLITNTFRPALEFVQRLFGGRVRTYPGKSKNRSAWSVLSYTGRPALFFLKAIEPYVRIKKFQVQLAVQYLERATRYKRRRGIDGKYTTLDSQEWNIRNDMRSQMIALNSTKGHWNMSKIKGDF